MAKARPRLPAQGKCFYFVDEAGDSSLFNARGRIIIGEPGCSRFFTLGVLQVDDPAALSNALDALRTRLLSDPYFEGVPSMQPQARRTALAFHAKDDPAEVRREVFALLHDFSGLRYYAVVRDKKAVLDYVVSRSRADALYHYNGNELYDYMVRRLFRERQHKHAEYEIAFAKRGNSDRTAALREALKAARERFATQMHISNTALISIVTTTPPHNGGLQAVDYFNWAVQRLYETGEERFAAYLWPQVRLIVDMDDIRKANYGRYYDKKHMLTAADAREWRK